MILGIIKMPFAADHPKSCALRFKEDKNKLKLFGVRSNNDLLTGAIASLYNFRPSDEYISMSPRTAKAGVSANLIGAMCPAVPGTPGGTTGFGTGTFTAGIGWGGGACIGLLRVLYARVGFPLIVAVVVIKISS